MPNGHTILHSRGADWSFPFGAVSPNGMSTRGLRLNTQHMGGTGSAKWDSNDPPATPLSRDRQFPIKD